MAGLTTITVDLERGEVVLGGRRVVLAAAGGDPGDDAGRPPSRFRLDDGAIVRVVGFGERSRIVRDALADSAPSSALVGLLRAAAHEGPCSILADAVLLATAGGAEAAPEFERCAVEASRLQAWSWLSVHDALAIVVDRAVGQPAGPDPAGGWNRFVFPASDTRELEALLQEMIASLLTRGMPVTAARADARRQDAQGADGPQPSPPATVAIGPRTPVRPKMPSLSKPGVRTARGAATPESRAHPAATGGAASAPAAPVLEGQPPRLWTAATPPGTSSPLPAGSAATAVTGRAPGPPPHASERAPSSPVAWPLTAWPPRTPGAASWWPPTAGAAATLRRGTMAAQHPAASLQGPMGPATAAHADAAPFPAIAAVTAPAAFMAPAAAPTAAGAAAGTGVTPMAMPADDLLDELAHALAAECDLRGLDA